jgi:hypothetical protein
MEFRAPTFMLPGKRILVFIELEAVRVGLRAILHRKFFPPENTIPVLENVAIARRLGGCRCPRIGVGMLVNRQAAVKIRTPIFLAPTVTIRTEMGRIHA